ncbi:DUF1206 domain-containing protein [Niastella populi]|uniref:DUF1206 domain-containing protein n=1 Tax=Niastella populi TaxID=550983 RepID=A0A1V9G6D8_9BACT|nr:DUF1206 domain-containing protein [Niastella populi]OQP66209.1 hypothetical protein A4R26_14060 [Niastella populi]
MAKSGKKTIIHYLPVYGCIATGIIYAAIGVIAILSFLKLRHGGADEASMMAILAKYLAGKIVIWIILLGTLCYIVWRFYETVTDPYDYGKNWKGIVKRGGIALSTIADILIVFAAVRVLLGSGNIQSDGQPKEERAMVQKLLSGPGPWPVITIGLIYLLTALVQLWYGVTRGYRERVNIDRFSAFFRYTVHALAWAGYAGRGIILGITGFFFVKAGITENARHVVNTDKAFDFIGDNIGHVYFIIVAVATICYGLFMFAQGVAYDTDKD